MSGCCGADTCRPATEGFAALRPVTTALQAFIADEGGPPEDLHELFPMGVPGLPAGTVAEIGPEGTGISIRRGDRLVTSAAYHPVPARGPASDGVYSLDFLYTGPGSNWCSWPTDNQQWECSGGY